ncbi:MAG: prepilin-type N-terminal cleavage/methylation domain-containing protein [Planctomycetaceae bacterium]|nr:prepilin-type N-terminal cleavage/methylation domain-containing protein [Planctomycetaceae bacterium]
MGLVGARRSRIRGARTGFTLVELLTVIGIIALLIAILLPALGRVRSHAKATQTAGLLNAIDKGLESFHADFGYYPDSRNPQSSSTGTKRREDPITQWPAAGDLPVPKNRANLTGAHWLARALAGHDLGGVDVNAHMLGYIYVNPTPHEQIEIPYSDFEKPNRYAERRPLYLNGEMYARDDDTTRFKTEPSSVSDYEPRRRIVVYDESFGSPVLYYRANASALNPFCRTGFGQNRMGASGDMAGIYCHQDNSYITGDDQTQQSAKVGWDFAGAGEVHRIGRFGLDEANVAEITEKQSFVDFLRNPDAPGQAKDAAGNTISITPHNPGTFILLTAGPDGLFGTSDDIGNFPIRK